MAAEISVVLDTRDGACWAATRTTLGQTQYLVDTQHKLAGPPECLAGLSSKFFNHQVTPSSSCFPLNMSLASLSLSLLYFFLEKPVFSLEHIFPLLISFQVLFNKNYFAPLKKK